MESISSHAHAPIGVFDSGVGGLSVLRAIHATLPAESLIYCADSYHAPYGERDNAFIIERTLAISAWLVQQGVKALVVACNTATAQANHLLREKFNIPIIGIEPGIKPAALYSNSRVAGVLATASTLRSEKFHRLMTAYAADCRFICQAGSGLVEAIERGETDSDAVSALLKTYLTPMLDAGADTLVLGSTHFPFLEMAIRRIAGDQLRLIETGEAVARQLTRKLAAQQLCAPPDAKVTLRLYSTANDGIRLQTLASQFLKTDQIAEHISIPSSSAGALS